MWRAGGRRRSAAAARGPRRRVRRAVAGAVQTRRACDRANSSSSPSRSGRVTWPLEPKARNDAPTELSAVARSAGHAVAAHERHRELVVGARRWRRSCQIGASRSSAATSAPERRERISSSPRWSMCWWVSTISSSSSIEWPSAPPAPARARRATCPSWARCRPASAVVLDQVAVDPPDQERRRAARGGGSRLGGQREPCGRVVLPRVDVGGVRVRAGHERITPSSSSRWASMSSRRAQRLEAQPQQRLGVRRAHVEVPVVVVDETPSRSVTSPSL